MKVTKTSIKTVISHLHSFNILMAAIWIMPLHFGTHA